jgi:hypothetical protein
MIKVFVIVLLLARFLVLLDFHPQIRVITVTIVSAAPFLLEFAFLWFIVLLCFGIMANLQLGWWFQDCKTVRTLNPKP